MNKTLRTRRPVAGRRWWLLLLASLLLGAGACQHAQPDSAQAAAPVAYYTCPMHAQIHADAPGDCPICHMHLEPVLAPAARQKPGPAAAVYTCPMHPQVREARPGQCPICGMDLVKTSSRPASKKPAATDPAADDLLLTAQQVALGNIRVLTLGPAAAPGPPVPTTTSVAVLTGTVVANAERTASISSRVAGRVERLYVRQTGQVLRRGAPVFAVYSEELQTLQHEYLLALAQSGPAGSPYQQLADATARKLRLLGLTAGQVQALARTGRVRPFATYYSPRSGTVQTLDVVQGQYVAEGSPLLTLTDLGSVWIEAQLYPAEARRLRLGQAVRVQVSGQPQPVRGTVVFLSPELSGDSQITLARIAVPNPAGRLQPGAQANVLLADAPPAIAAAGGGAPALRVPPAAIVHDGAASYLWRQTGERQFRRVRVQTGDGTAATVPVLTGLRPGDRVVVSGAYLLESEFTLRQGAGDDHMSGMAM